MVAEPGGDGNTAPKGHASPGADGTMSRTRNRDRRRGERGTMLLVAIFRHWGYPLLIMTTIPLGIAGGIVGLVLFNAVGALLAWLGLGGLWWKLLGYW